MTGLTLDDLQARYPVPADLTVDVRGGMVYLQSGDKRVEIETGGRRGVFKDGPVAWDHLLMVYLLPALAQFYGGAMTEYDGERTREELRTTAEPGVYRVTGERPRRIAEWYDVERDVFEHDVVVETIARVRLGAGQLPATGECYQEGDRQVIFSDVRVL